MEDKKRLAFVYLMNKVIKMRKKRKWWVHPQNSTRLLQSAFYTMYSDLKADGEKFFNYFRMSPPSFEELVSKLRDGIARQDTTMRLSIPPEEAVALSVRYLASGCSLTELHHTYKIGISTASEVVRRVCTQVWDKMKEECVPEPDEQEWYSIAAGFEKYANFPHCIGAIDGKLINSKKNGPLVLLVAVDTSHRFTSVQIIPYGTSSDSSIFYDSHLWRKLQENALNIPKPELLPGTDEQLPFVFVGDEAFVLSANILRPYSGRNLPDRKKIFNYRLSRARRYVECAFGILSNKWGIFHRPLNVNMDFAIGLVQACCVLHNFVLERDGVNFDDTLTITGLEDFEFGDPVQGGRIANKYRDTFSNYFISDVGQVKWQYTRI